MAKETDLRYDVSEKYTFAFVRYYGARRSVKQAEKRVLEATGRQDACNSLGAPHTRQKVSNHARALIDDRETLEHIREALGPDLVFDLLLVNTLYEPARTHILGRVRRCAMPYVL